jgi:hypothetical protein
VLVVGQQGQVGLGVGQLEVEVEGVGEVVVLEVVVV